MTATTVSQAHCEQDAGVVQELFWEYLVWANDRNDQEFDIRLDIAAMLEQDMANLDRFMPPQGRLLLAKSDGSPSGCICLKQLKPGIGEVKRLYVRPAFRGTGVGKLLVAGLLNEAQQIGYSAIRLDSARFMTAAHALYRSSGFQDIAPYPESEIPEEFHVHWVFMELSLAG